ncbi:hypothetical protein ABDB91_17450 [Desulfoscipio sp. XC116]|uniref:hypothetical protein n=1 Tax=Desulfoscipio sp. XC116 TaxID=3144975 RepID=UPI00325AF37F
MRKFIVLAMTLLLSLAMVPAAFAYSGGYFSNGDSGWVSNGQHGHYWSGDFDGPALVRGIHDNSRFNPNDWGYGYSRGGSLYRYYDAGGKAHYYYDWDNDGDWYYYKDNNGKSRYVYIDPDRDGKWYRYYDRSGNIQYYYDIR